MAYPRLPSPRRARALQTALLAWYHAQARPLPWRGRRDPYAIWVSEVMLQQTQVTTVIPYFQRFLAAFPTLADLASASEQAVLRLWEGLGYYRRARALHAAARRIMTEHGGQFPRQAAQLAALPGLGRYTVNAVLSQAFDQPLPVVDANVARVACRLFACTEPVAAKQVQAWLWATAERLVPSASPGTFNQALMELGQTCCTPKAPACLFCPLAQQCLARRRGQQEQLPRRQPPPLITTTREVSLIIRRGAAVLLARNRPESPRWAGLWEFPRLELNAGESVQAGCTRLLASRVGLGTTRPTLLGTLRHGVTRFRIELHCLTARYLRGQACPGHYAEFVWADERDRAGLPLSRPQRQLADWWAARDPAPARSIPSGGTHAKPTARRREARE